MSKAAAIDFRQLPALPFAAAVTAGIALSLHCDLESGVLLLAGAGLLILAEVLLWMRRHRIAFIAALLFFGLVGAWRTSAELDRPTRRAVEAIGTSGSVEAIGRIHWVETAGAGRTRVLVESAVLGDSTSIISLRRLRITLYGDSAELSYVRCGDLIFAAGRFRPFSLGSRSSEGAAIQMLTRREGGTLFADSGSVVVQRGSGFSRARAVAAVHRSIGGILDRELSPDAAALSKALLFGDRAEFGGEFAANIRLTGLSHLFALSGMNVGLLLALLWLTMTALCVPRTLRLWLLLIAALAYMELGREAPSLVRAAFMAALLITGQLLYRRAPLLNIVAAAVLLELLWRPLDLIDAGFLLSYLAVLGLLSSFDVFRQWLQKLTGNPAIRVLRSALDLGAASLAAQVATLPLVGLLFQRIPVLGVLGNVVAVPAFGLYLILTVLLLAISPLSVMLALPVAHAMDLLAWSFGKGTALLASVPLAGVAVPAPFYMMSWLVGAAVLFLCTGFLLRRGSWVAVAVLTLLSLYLWSPVLAPRPECTISFVDVENGDAILISTANGRNVLVDTGPSFPSGSAAERIERLLRERNIHSLDAVVLTHPDNDHVGGTAELLCHVPVRRLFANLGSRESFTVELVRAASASHHLPLEPLRAGQVLPLSPDTRLTVVAPGTDVYTSARSDNQQSTVLKLDALGATALLTADIDSTVEVDLAGWGDFLQADLLKVAHHGSGSSTGVAFLNQVRPQIAVLSYARGNIYGHPHGAVRERLRIAGVEIFETAREGTVTFEAHDGTWRHVESPGRRKLKQWHLIDAKDAAEQH